MAVEVCQVLEPDLVADCRYRLIRRIKHRTGLTDANPVEEFQKPVAGDFLKVSGKGGRAHASQLRSGLERDILGKMLGDMVHHTCDTCMLVAVFGLGDRRNGKLPHLGMLVDLDKQLQEGKDTRRA